MKWSEKFKVKFHETDANEMVGVSQTFKYIQEAAMCQLKAQHPSYEELFQQKKAFVLSSIRLEMHSPIFAYDEIIARSWACPSRGVNFLRCYEIERDGEIVCEASSIWALVSTEERKIYTVADVDTSSYFTDDVIQTECPVRVRISSALPMSLQGEYTVTYNDIDMNGHMNNTNYARIICNYIRHPERVRVKSIGIYFANDAKLGESIKIYMSRVDNRYYFKTLREDGKINIESEIIVEEI